MAKGAKESALQRARRLEMKALALAVHGKAQMVTAAMNKFPKIVEDLFEVAKREVAKSGGNIEHLGDAGPASSPKAPLVLANTAHNPESDGTVGSNADAASASGAGDGSGRASENSQKRLDQLTAAELSDILSSVEDVVLSKFALKALLRPGQRVVPKEPLLQLMEFAFAMNRGTRVNMSPGYKAMLMSQLRAANEANGGRASTLRLPPNWAEQGVYLLLRTAPPVVKVQHRFNGACRVIPEGHLEGVDATKLYIGNNYSDDSAYLAVQDGVLNFPLNVLFSKERLDNLHGSATKRRRSVLTDGVTSDAGLGSAASRGGPDAHSPPADAAAEAANEAASGTASSGGRGMTDEAGLIPPLPPA